MDSPQRRSRTPPYRYSDSPSPRRSSRGRSRSRTPPSRRDRSDVREDALNPGNNLYVTGLSTRVTEKDLDEHFSQEGKVVECRLVVDPRTRESRGFGFVTMDNGEDADRCVKYLNRSTLEGRIITVEKFYESLRVSGYSRWVGAANYSTSMPTLLTLAGLRGSGQGPQLQGNILVYELPCKPIHVDTEETMEDGMEAEIATVIVEHHGTPLIEAGMAGIENALLATLHTVDTVGNAPVHHDTRHIVVEF